MGRACSRGPPSSQFFSEVLFRKRIMGGSHRDCGQGSQATPRSAAAIEGTHPSGPWHSKCDIEPYSLITIRNQDPLNKPTSDRYGPGQTRPWVARNGSAQTRLRKGGCFHLVCSPRCCVKDGLARKWALPFLGCEQRRMHLPAAPARTTLARAAGWFRSNQRQNPYLVSKVRGGSPA